MDFSKSSADTVRMNQTHSFKLDLSLHQHILYPRVFPLLVFRGFHLAFEYSFGLVVPVLLRETLSHLCGVGLWKKQRFREAFSQRSSGSWPTDPKVEPERGYRYSAEASPSVAGPRDSPFLRAKNLSVIVAGGKTDHPGRLCRTESAALGVWSFVQEADS